METQVQLAQNAAELIWTDTFAMENGFLYATTNKLPFALNDLLNWDNEESHFRVIRLFIDDKGYLEP